ncbi:MAG: hypothetical protein NTV34_11450 [Proteobacteria bacterium]|nr:hypothetical protein [Pseudomonadota bacterium]
MLTPAAGDCTNIDFRETDEKGLDSISAKFSGLEPVPVFEEMGTGEASESLLVFPQALNQ